MTVIDYGYITGWVATIVLVFIAPLLVVLVVYLARINYKLAAVKRVLSVVFPSETHESENYDCWDSYLEKIFVRRRNRKASSNNLEYEKQDNSNNELHGDTLSKSK